MKTRMCGCLALVALLCLTVQAGAAQDGKNPEEGAIVKNAEGFIEAFHNGDAKAVAAFWAMDGDYTDQAGNHVKGREAIEKLFAGLFAENKGLKVRITGLSLRFVTPDVAIEDGMSEVFTPDGAPPSRARYTIVHAKKDGQWRLASVRDAAFAPPTNYTHLRSLEGLIGNWVTDTESGAVEHISFTWAENQNFILGSFSTSVKDIAVGSAKKWIGYDPSTKRIRSWTFDATGGFGEGAWTHSGKQWVIKTASVLPDGKKATATYIATPIDRNTLTWQVRDQTVDGNPLPDSKEHRMKRVKTINATN